MLNSLIDTILRLPIFEAQPPVLIDIGASGALHADWKEIAKYSVCIGFDADSRDFDTNENKFGFKKLYLINSIVSDKEDPKTTFYLTQSPYCSSVLKPVRAELLNWRFSELFEIDKEIELNNTSLKTVLEKNAINYIDWFKTDSQGIDLRLFKNLAKNIQEKVVVAEFEPGFIDAYEGEDKISDLLNYISGLPFWLSDCEVKGTQRISKDTLSKYKINPESLNLRNSSCWAEFTYINTCEKLEIRELLLTVVFCIIKKQYGFALDLCTKLNGKIDKELFHLIESTLLNELTRVPAKSSIIQKIKNRLL